MRWIFAAIAVAATLSIGACGGSGDKSVKLELSTPKPRAHASNGVVTIAGRATDGAVVKIADRGALRSPHWSSPDRWTYQLNLKPGSNVVRVTATKRGYRPASVAMRFPGPAIKLPGARPVSAGVMPRRPPVKRGANRFSPRQGAAYQSAQSFCYETGEQRLARKYHTPKHAFDIAKAYSGTRPQWAQQAVFEGCLSGFGDRG